MRVAGCASRISLWRHREFLKFWAGSAISDVGSQVTVLAVPLIAALTLDATPWQMGLLAAAGSAPILLVGCRSHPCAPSLQRALKESRAGRQGNGRSAPGISRRLARENESTRFSPRVG